MERLGEEIISDMGLSGEVHIVTHRNPDIDALVSSYLLQYFYDVLSVTTEPEDLSNANIIVVDMPITKDLGEIVVKNGLNVVAHYDHHYEGCKYTCTAEVIREVFKNSWEPWMDYFVKLARLCDTGKVLTLDDEIKYFHVSGYLAAVRRLGRTDNEIINEFFTVFDVYAKYFRELIKMREVAGSVPIYEIGRYKVAVIGNKNVDTSVLAEQGVHLFVYESEFGIGITRNVNVSEPDLTKLKDAISVILKEKGKPEEIEEWFFHPKGFIACRGSRKHPVKTPSALTVNDLIRAMKMTFG